MCNSSEVLFVLLYCFYFLISSYDCSNPIYGQTLNPHNLQKTSGGSSGGEGALVGGGGSVLGIGSDIGGSIRIPSSFCGICGFKPTSGRLRWVCMPLPGLCINITQSWLFWMMFTLAYFFVSLSVHRAWGPFTEGRCQVRRKSMHRCTHCNCCLIYVLCYNWPLFLLFLINVVLASSGPMAKDVESLALCMRALLCDHMFTLDPTVPPLPFNMQVCQVKSIFIT